jgi:hypothetical protein
MFGALSNSMSMKSHRPRNRRVRPFDWGTCYDRAILTLGTIAGWVAIILMLRALRDYAHTGEKLFGPIGAGTSRL